MWWDQPSCRGQLGKIKGESKNWKVRNVFSTPDVWAREKMGCTLKRMERCRGYLEKWWGAASGGECWSGHDQNICQIKNTRGWSQEMSQEWPLLWMQACQNSHSQPEQEDALFSLLNCSSDDSVRRRTFTLWQTLHCHQTNCLTQGFH